MNIIHLIKYFFLSVILIKRNNIESKTVRFSLPDKIERSRKDAGSSSDESDSTDSTSSSSVELVNANGRFRHLKKDDDLLKIKKNKKKIGTKRINEKREQVKLNSKDNDYVSGGKQEIGFIYNMEWRNKVEKMKSIESINGFSTELEKFTSGIITEPLNAGWWLFNFEFGKSKLSKTIFKFQTSFPVKVSLVDLFCRGDSFAVYDEEKLIAQSSRIRPDPDCLEKMISPDEALSDGRWSSVVFELESGYHNIEIKTIDSPINHGGLAAIKFDQILPIKGRRVSRSKVCRGYNGLVVITEKVLISEAEVVCLQMKMNLAKIGKDADMDESAIKRSISSCSGRDGRVWIVESETGSIKTINMYGNIVDSMNEMKSMILCRTRI